MNNISFTLFDKVLVKFGEEEKILTVVSGEFSRGGCFYRGVDSKGKAIPFSQENVIKKVNKEQKIESNKYKEAIDKIREVMQRPQAGDIKKIKDILEGVD